MIEEDLATVLVLSHDPECAFFYDRHKSDIITGVYKHIIVFKLFDTRIFFYLLRQIGIGEDAIANVLA
jgi:hypothetical protein